MSRRRRLGRDGTRREQERQAEARAHRPQSLSSSLIPVFERVLASTVLTITAQARPGPPSLPGSVPGTTTE